MESLDEFLARSPKKRTPSKKYPKHKPNPGGDCPPDRILNPLTGNCIHRFSILGRKFVQEQEGFVPKQPIHPIAAHLLGRKATSPPLPPRNPAPELPPRERRATSPVLPPLRPKSLPPKFVKPPTYPKFEEEEQQTFNRKECPENMILNPRTGNCVQLYSRLGKKILSEYQ